MLLLAEWKKVQRITKSIVVKLEESHHAALWYCKSINFGIKSTIMKPASWLAPGAQGMWGVRGVGTRTRSGIWIVNGGKGGVSVMWFRVAFKDADPTHWYWLNLMKTGTICRFIVYCILNAPASSTFGKNTDVPERNYHENNVQLSSWPEGGVVSSCNVPLSTQTCYLLASDWGWKV